MAAAARTYDRVCLNVVATWLLSIILLCPIALELLQSRPQLLSLCLILLSFVFLHVGGYVCGVEMMASQGRGWMKMDQKNKTYARNANEDAQISCVNGVCMIDKVLEECRSARKSLVIHLPT